MKTAKFVPLFLVACATDPIEPQPLERFPWASGYNVHWNNPTLVAEVHGGTPHPFTCEPDLCHFFTNDTVGTVSQDYYWQSPLWQFGPQGVEFETSIPWTDGDSPINIVVPGTIARDSTGARQPTKLVVDDTGVWRGKMSWLTSYMNKPASVVFDFELVP